MKKIIVLIITIFTISIANAQWQQTNLDSTGVTSLVISGNNIFAGVAGAGEGVYISTNNGSSWAKVNTGLVDSNVWSLAINGSNLFAGTANGVYLSTNNGGSWVEKGITGFKINTILINGNNIFAGTQGDGVLLSLDNGNSWDTVNTGLPTQTIVRALAISGSNIYLGTLGGMYISTNNGNSWSEINNGLPFGIDMDVLSLAISGSNIYVGILGGMFTSTNNGNNWTTIDTGLTNIDVYTLALNASNFFAGTWGGVFLSTNNGSSWVNVSTGLTDTNIYKLAINNNFIFAGTLGKGVWRRPLSDFPSGIKKNILNNNISVYPNPVTNQTTIAYPQLNEEGDIIIYNMLGQIVNKEKLTKGSSQLKLNIHNYKAGLYKVILREKGMMKGEVSLVKN